MSDYRVLIMAPRSITPQQEEELFAAVSDMLRRKAPHLTVHCTLVEDERARSGAGHSSSADWAKYVMQGVDPDDCTPLYNAVVVLDRRLGRTEAAVVSAALEGHRMAILKSGGSWSRVTEVKCDRPGDHVAGWVTS